MFNTSKHSSERSNRQTQQRRESSHRGSNTQKSKSSHSSPSQRSESIPQWKVPVWVNCEKCHETSIIDLMLLACGHISCKRCLRIQNSPLPTQPLHCLICKTPVSHRCLDTPLETKLQGMFQASWMDPVLQINMKQIQFMMKKTHDYLKFISKSVNRNQGLPPQWMERYNQVKMIHEHNKKLQKIENDIMKKAEVEKFEAMKKYKNLQALRSFYEKKKKADSRKTELRQQTLRGNYEKDMKFVSSGRNEGEKLEIAFREGRAEAESNKDVSSTSLPRHSNQYIGQLKTSQRPTNQNQSAVNIRSLSQRMVPQMTQRPNVSLNQYRQDTQKVTSRIDSRRPSIQSATFRPTTRDFKSDNNHRPEPISHAQKRLAPSYNYDEYTTPSKRATNYPIRREPNLDTSNTSSGGSSLRLKESSRFNTHANSIGIEKYSNLQDNSVRIPKYQ